MSLVRRTKAPGRVQTAVTLLVLACAFGSPGCRGPRATPDVEVLAPGEEEVRQTPEPSRAPQSTHAGIVAIAGLYAVEGATFLFWDVPVFVLYRVPKLVFWDGPAALVDSLRTDRGRIDAAIEKLRDPSGLSIEREREIFSELERLTGLAFADRSDWIAWWGDNKERPRSTWRAGFVENAFVLLASDDYWPRLVGADRLRRVSGIDPGYDAKASAIERQAAAEAWQKWWNCERGPTR